MQPSLKHCANWRDCPQSVFQCRWSGLDLHGPLEWRSAVFPWRDANQFKLLIDGPQFFARYMMRGDGRRSGLLTWSCISSKAARVPRPCGGAGASGHARCARLGVCSTAMAAWRLPWGCVDG